MTVPPLFRTQMQALSHCRSKDNTLHVVHMAKRGITLALIIRAPALRAHLLPRLRHTQLLVVCKNHIVSSARMSSCELESQTTFIRWVRAGDGGFQRRVCVGVWVPSS